MDDVVDLLIVGGGINGTGIARDASGRGVSVMLVEQDDLASHTSSASTKLIHGGLRYLEYYEFGLVKKALREREVLMGIAPHIISPLQFVLPYRKGLRPAPLIRLGLFLYDFLAGKNSSMPRSKSVHLHGSTAGQGLKKGFVKGFSYSDCWADDSRLVVLNALDAAERGACVKTRTRLVSSEREGSLWVSVIEDVTTNKVETVKSRAIVNAAGPWVDSLLGRLGMAHLKSSRLVKGSHIIVPKLFEGDHAYFMQNPDKRIFFAIPYEKDFTLIGTTDVEWTKLAQAAAISDEEIDYLCDGINGYFEKPIGRDDIVHSFSGIRSLYDDDAGSASATTRDYVLNVDSSGGTPSLLSIFGGKLTTYRKLAEDALEHLEPYLTYTRGKWTGTVPLPGGDLPGGTLLEAARRLKGRYPFLSASLLDRLCRLYGSRADVLLKGVCQPEDMGQCFGAELYAVEVDYLMTTEWAKSVEDILYRRTKLGLRLSTDEKQQLDRYLSEKLPASVGVPEKRRSQ